MKNLINLSIYIGIVTGMLLYLPSNSPHTFAAGKAAFTLPTDTITRWLDNGNNHSVFIEWAKSELTQSNIESLEALIAPPPDNAKKLEAVNKAIRVLVDSGFKDNDEAYQSLQTIKIELETLQIQVNDTVDTQAHIVGGVKVEK